MAEASRKTCMTWRVLPAGMMLPRECPELALSIRLQRNRSSPHGLCWHRQQRWRPRGDISPDLGPPAGPLEVDGGNDWGEDEDGVGVFTGAQHMGRD